MIGGKQTSGPSPGERDRKEHEGSPKVLSQNGHGAMIFSFFWLSSSRCRSHSCSHARSSNDCVSDGECTHTHLLHVHFLVYIHGAYTSHILMRVTHMHGSRVSAVRMSFLPWLTFSLLMFHPFLLLSSLLFLDGHFETTPDYDLTDFDVQDLPQNFPDLEAQVKRTPHEDELSGYLAKPAFIRRFWAQEVRQDHICGQWHDAHWRYLRLFENHRKNIGQFGVSAVFEFSVSHISHWWFLFLREKAKKACNRETVARQREREEREGPVISAAELMSMKSRRNRIRSHSPTTRRQFDSDDRDLRVHLEWRAQQASLGENSAQKKDTRLSTTRRSKIRNEEIQNTQYVSHNESMNLKEDISCADQAQCERIHSWSKLKMKNRLHQDCYARSCQDFEGLRIRRYQEEKTEKQQRLEEFPMQDDQESRTVSLFFHDLDWRPTFIKLLLPRVCRKPSRKVGMPRNTREDMRYSWKRFWLSTCSTRSWWITQWFKEFGDIIGHSENRRNWGKWERRTIAINTFILFSSKSKIKSLDGGKRPLFMTRHGNSELSPLGNASVIPWPNKISEPNCEFPSRSLRKSS